PIAIDRGPDHVREITRERQPSVPGDELRPPDQGRVDLDGSRLADRLLALLARHDSTLGPENHVPLHPDVTSLPPRTAWCSLSHLTVEDGSCESYQENLVTV